MPSSGPYNPTVAAIYVDGGNTWVNPNNIFSQEGSSATSTGNTGQTSDQLRGTKFGLADPNPNTPFETFNIPDGATINGIEVTWVYFATGSVFGHEIRLVKAGSPVGQNKATFVAWPGTSQSFGFGGANDLWGSTWTPAEIKDPLFGVQIAAAFQSAGAVANVDNVRITVYYTGAAGIQTSTAVVVPTPVNMNNVLWMIDNQSPDRQSLTAKDGRISVKMAVPFTGMYNYFLQLVGFSYTQITTPGMGLSKTYKLMRRLPAAHPGWRTFICTGISDAYGYQFAGSYTGAGAFIQRFQLPKGSLYNWCIFTAQFEPIPIKLWPDEALVGEQYRYISYEYDGRAEYLTRPPGFMGYKEGPSPPVGAKYPGQSISLEQKTDYEMTWHQVPEDWISVNAVGELCRPTKILSCVGAVNSVEFLGFEAGTLLMLKPKIKRYPSPLILTDPKLGSVQSFYCDITFKFVFFDPPLVAGATTKGHNAKPFFSGSGTKTLYSLATMMTNDVPPVPGTVGTYPGRNFNEMFGHVSDGRDP